MTAIGPIVYAFFEQHLKAEKGLSPASVRSYRDALRLFLILRRGGTWSITDPNHRGGLTAERVRHFLGHLETCRGNHIRSRNQRLAGLHTFFNYLARQVPEALAEAERVAAIPRKRASPPPTQFLERDEIETLIAGLPATGHTAVRDRALLLFLYNTGARVQEAADLRIGNLELGPQPRVNLHGKGDKWRACPLWPETARLLHELLAERATVAPPTAPIFTSRQGGPLTRYGIYKLVRRHAAHLTASANGGPPRRVSPHVLRHTTAVHLLEAGVCGVGAGLAAKQHRRATGTLKQQLAGPLDAGLV
jgi:integrase/recombinase XerD